MDTLTKEQILKQDDLKTELVQVPEWGGAVWVRTLTGTERDLFEADTIIKRDNDVCLNYDNFRAKLCVRTIVDTDGKRLFEDKDAIVLGNKSAAALDRVFEVAQRLNGLRAQDIDELVKNSGSVPSADSTSD